jgi:hypothetical protein
MKNVKCAKETEGHLIYTAMGEFMFRVYNPDKTFTDYRILHSDLLLKITDEDAVFYEDKNGTPVLDHSPSTLGLR